MSKCICPHCGASIEEEYKICPNCGYDVASQKSATNGFASPREMDMPEAPSTPVAAKGTIFQSKKTVVFLILAVIVFIMSLVAGNQISNAASQIGQIRSVGGQTLEEAYYVQLNNLYSGYAVFVRTCGVFFAGIFIYFGWKKPGEAD